MAMEWTDVDSSQLEAVGYDAETEEAQVRFVNGSVYSYQRVPQSVIDGIINASSAGRQFNETLKYGFAYKRL
jgi:hypothetical protein